VCEEGFDVRIGTSLSGSVGILAPFAVDGELKGNSPGSFGDRGEPVGAERMILGAPFEGLYMSCVSFAVCPARSGDNILPGSSGPLDTAGDLDRGLRVIGETSEFVEPAMEVVKGVGASGNERKGLSSYYNDSEIVLLRRSRIGSFVVARSVDRYSAMVSTENSWRHSSQRDDGT
jgi:hypothetical protein